MEATNNNKKLKGIFAALLIALFLIGLGVSFYIYNRPQQKAIREYRQFTQKYFNLTPQEANFFRDSQELEKILSRQAGLLPPPEEATQKVMLADSLSDFDRVKATLILKDVVLNSEYPDAIRVRALTYIADHYEMDFIDRDFAKNVIFAGEVFEDLLTDSDEDEELAIRRLNEWSNALFPNVVANYRIAKWYARQVYKNPGLPLAERTALIEKMEEHITAGDNLLVQYGDSLTPNRIGIAYEAKARALHLAGRIEEAETSFQLAIAEYLRPPLTIFQVVHLSNARFYYAAFLARNYGTGRAEEIRQVLRREYDYLATPQPPEKRNVRLVSFLVAARDSQLSDYPALDFNKKDIELISQIYPEFGQLIKELNLAEYVKGHPLESQIGQ